jgi:hypothetical protein
MGTLNNIWKNRKEILEGLGNTIFKKDYIEQIASERMKLCMACPHIDEVGNKCALPGTQPCCGLCGCKLTLKTRSLSSECAWEENKQWPALLNHEEQDDLYKKIEYHPDVDL